MEGGWEVKVAESGWGWMSEEGGMVVGQLAGLVRGIHANLLQQKLSHPVELGESLGLHTHQVAECLLKGLLSLHMGKPDTHVKDCLQM